MTGELPRPEIENTPEARFFNVEAMSDEQVMILWRALAETSYRLCFGETETKAEHEADRVTEQRLIVCDGIWGNLVRETGALVDRNPERVKDLVRRCAQSRDGLDRELAARVAPSLVECDYGFTRDALVFLSVDHNPYMKGRDFWSDVAQEQTALLMRDALSPEQIADFNARLTFYGKEFVNGPAPDDA